MENRNDFIGGSDIAAIMNASPWKTPLKLWAEKSGKAEPEDLSKNEAVQMGIELEETVARVFSKRTGLSVRRSPKRYVHPDYPHFSCQVDRLITGTDELLECKTASAWTEKKWEGEEIPVEYVLQVQWQLMITGRTIGWIAVLIGGQKFISRKIEADSVLHETMIQAANDFWDMVKKGIQPAPAANDKPFMVQLFPIASEQIQEAAQDMNDTIALLQQTKAQIIDLEKIKNECEAKIMAAIGNLKGIQTKEYTAKWINVKGSTFTVTKPDSRQLRISRN